MCSPRTHTRQTTTMAATGSTGPPPTRRPRATSTGASGRRRACTWRAKCVAARFRPAPTPMSAHPSAIARMTATAVAGPFRAGAVWPLCRRRRASAAGVHDLGGPRVGVLHGADRVPGRAGVFPRYGKRRWPGLSGEWHRANGVGLATDCERHSLFLVRSFALRPFRRGRPLAPRALRPSLR